jgi:hypothetical protein
MRALLAALAAAAGLGCTTVNPSRAQVPTHGLGDEVLRAMRADAARRAGVAASAAQVLSVQPVTWPDASLGCPQPGTSYAQVLVPGWRVQVEAGGTRLDYHAGRRGAWLMCPAQRAQPPLANGPSS